MKPQKTEYPDYLNYMTPATCCTITQLNPYEISFYWLFNVGLHLH